MKNKIEKIVIKSLSKKTWIHGYNLCGNINDKMDIRYNTMDLRDLIKSLRKQGYRIIANSHKGYKIAADKKELQIYCNKRIREITEELKTIKHMQKGK